MNKQKIVEYIRSGAKPSENIGVEIEHFMVNSANESISYYGKDGVGAVLEELARFFDEKIYSEGQLIALSNGRYHLTLEPAAQLEISIEPLQYIDEIEKIYHEFYDLIHPILESRGYRLVTLGYQPHNRVADLPLIPKQRYELMDRYFSHSGKYGKNMMRGTASAQVSIDYTDERDCILKFRLANALVPILALITDNAPIFEGERYGGRMIRTKIWSDVDNARCGIVPGGTDKDFSLERYADYLLNTPPILIEDNGKTIYTNTKTTQEIYREREMTKADIEHILSMFFPDVRLKQYIEIRPADSMPIPYTLAYAAFIKGIFLCLSSVCDELGLDNIHTEDVENAKKKLMADGFHAIIYGRRVTDILNELLNTAEASLPDRDRIYLNPLSQLVRSRTTLKNQKKEG